MSIARRLSAAALAALMTLGLTACSGGEESSTAAKSGLEDGVLTRCHGMCLRPLQLDPGR